MKKIYSCLKQATVAVAICFGLLSHTEIFAQATDPCGVVVEDFQTTSTNGGFVGNGFAVASQGSRRFLQRANVTGNVTYTVTSPTYKLANSQNVIGYGFVLAGSQMVATVTAKILYTTGGQVTTVTITTFTPTYSGGQGNQIATVCRAVNISELPGFAAGGSYRLLFEIVPVSGAGASTDIFTIDDFRTTGAFSSITLPVTFVGFEAKSMSNGVQVAWKTAEQDNVHHYEVEKSTDGQNYNAITTVGVSKSNEYSYFDANVGRNVYYRIKNVDNNGKFKYSSVARISNGLSSVVMNAFPQPAASRLTVQHASIRANALFTLSTTDGRVVSRIRPVAGTMQTILDVSKLQGGAYLLRFNDGNGNTETLKVIKQ